MLVSWWRAVLYVVDAAPGCRSSGRRVSGARQRLPGNRQLVDLAGAFVEAEQPDIAIEAFDRVVGDIAISAVHLDAAVGHAAAHFGCEVLAYRRRERDIFSLVALARDRKSTRLNSSHVKISYAVFCLKKKTR